MIKTFFMYGQIRGEGHIVIPHFTLACVSWGGRSSSNITTSGHFSSKMVSMLTFTIPFAIIVPWKCSPGYLDTVQHSVILCPGKKGGTCPPTPLLAITPGHRNTLSTINAKLWLDRYINNVSGGRKRHRVPEGIAILT